MVECQSHGMIGHVVSLHAPAPNQRREIPVGKSGPAKMVPSDGTGRKWRLHRLRAVVAGNVYGNCGFAYDYVSLACRYSLFLDLQMQNNTPVGLVQHRTCRSSKRCCTVISLLASMAAAAPAEAATTTRVSVGAGGVQGGGASTASDISANGRFVAFSSSAANLVPGDRNGEEDVFLRDLVRNETYLVSTATGRKQGNRFSDRPAVSADGRLSASSRWRPIWCRATPTWTTTCFCAIGRD